MNGKYVHLTNGNYLGFINGNNFFSRDGAYLGWVEGDSVWDKSGKYRGRLVEISGTLFILKHKFSVSPLPRVPKVPPISPVPPVPVANKVPIVVPIPFEDGFQSTTGF